MVTVVRKTFVLIVMALVMLASLFGWTMRMEMSVPVHHAASTHTSHSLADGGYICPPPPFNCHG